MTALSRQEIMKGYQRKLSRDRMSSGPKPEREKLEQMRTSNLASKEDVMELRKLVTEFVDQMKLELSIQSGKAKRLKEDYEDKVEQNVRKEINNLNMKLNLPVQKQLNIPVSIDQGGTGATTAAQAIINLGLATSNTIYFGDQNTNGSWRITTSGDNLAVERRESGSWVEKSLFLAS